MINIYFYHNLFKKTLYIVHNSKKKISHPLPSLNPTLVSLRQESHKTLTKVYHMSGGCLVEEIVFHLFIQHFFQTQRCATWHILICQCMVNLRLNDQSGIPLLKFHLSVWSLIVCMGFFQKKLCVWVSIL